MKQDWELIRKILVATEEQPPRGSPDVNTIAADVGCSHNEVVGHIEMLSDAGYLKARIIRGSTGADQDGVMILGITMPGYDLLKNLRNATVWGKIKSIAKDKGLDITLDAIKIIGPTAIKFIAGG